MRSFRLLALFATITVLVQETQVRKRPQFYAPSAGSARLGDKFEGQGPDAGWYQVQGGRPGFIHASAVTAKRVKLGSALGLDGGGDASVEEITLAGKGFNAQVEKAYSGKQGGRANFSGVNAMERRSVGEAQLLQFMRIGDLIPGERP